MGFSGSVVLCGCETFCLTLSEEQTPKVFYNTVLRIIFGNFMRLEKSLYSDASPNITRMIKSRKMRGAKHVPRMGESILVGKSERKRPLGRSRRRWEDNM
jgi:hypothetical protein